MGGEKNQDDEEEGEDEQEEQDEHEWNNQNISINACWYNSSSSMTLCNLQI